MQKSVDIKSNTVHKTTECGYATPPSMAQNSQVRKLGAAM